MSPDKIESFRQFTGADAETARSFLNLCEDNLEMAVGLYMEDPNSANNSVNAAPAAEEYRSPIPQRTERLIPIDIPIYSSHFERGATLRTRRRAFVADDSDDEIQLVGENLPGTTDSLSSLPNGSSSSATDAHSGSSNGDTSSRGSRSNGARPELPSKRGYLRQLYQPPTEILFDGTLLAAQAAAREKNQWLLVSLHDEGCFDCHLLNRDVWKDSRVYQTIRRNFVFLQLPVDSPEGIRFRSLHSYVQSASHISILNPYTGEQSMMWMHLKDAATVHEALTEFLQHTKLQSPVNSSIVASDPQPGHSHDRLTTSSSVIGVRRTHSDHPEAVSSLPVKRPRLGRRDTETTATLSTRVAAVSSQLDNTTAKDGLTSHSTSSRANLLDLSEEEQIRLAIEASTVETKQSCSSRSSCKNVDSDDETFIVLTDDDEEESNEVAAFSPQIDSPVGGAQSDCFLYDPEAYPSTTSTATISCRRPLRATRDRTTTSYSSSVISTVNSIASMNASTSKTNSVPCELSPPRLPEPKPHEDTIELAMRMPDGQREVYRLASSLTLQTIQRYFNLRGFPHTRYELVRLYPHQKLSTLSPQTTLAKIGLAKKDTLFLQER
ncbi:UBX domain-containing protein 2 [Fasciola gigantica]|uniref:UBX domain-containing protein 2 n=1 Tax=Fasciola gigantica TaxID=46835 RepID=A0A504YQG2_FASGI|nr:UBX domain-containing protein 2 [Fasciola gigantica]